MVSRDVQVTIHSNEKHLHLANMSHSSPNSVTSEERLGWGIGSYDNMRRVEGRAILFPIFFHAKNIHL
jgi:hypothetical protein